MSEVKAIFLDFGNVIIDIDPIKSFDALQSLISTKNVAFTEDGSYFKEVTDKHQSGAISDVLFINSILKYARHDVQAIDVINAWNAMLLDISKDTIAVLKELKAKYPLYLLSNTNQIHIDYCLRYLHRVHDIADWSSYFNHIVYSHRIKMAKPDDGIYIYAERLASCAGPDLLFIDDKVENTDAAASRGWQVICKPEREPLRETMTDYL